MDYAILFGVFTLLMLVGTPIAFCLGVASKQPSNAAEQVRIVGALPGQESGALLWGQYPRFGKDIFVAIHG